MSDISKIKVHALIDPFDIKDANSVHWTEREGYVGKNLIKQPYLDGNNITKNGVTFTVNDDGSITINGTATADAIYQISSRSSGMSMLKNGQYKVYIADFDNKKIICSLAYGKNSWLPIASNIRVSPYNFEITNTQQDGSCLAIEVIAPKGYTYNNVIVQPMICLASIQDATYEPYLPTNTELEENIETRIAWEEANGYVGKNLIPSPYYETSKSANDVTFTVNSDNSITVNTTGASADTNFEILNGVNLKVDGKYILSGCPSGGSTSTYGIQLYSTNSSAGAIYDVGNGYTFTENQYVTRIVIRIRKDTVLDNVTFYPMIRLASIADDTYEPYLPTNKDLKSNIGNLSDLTTTAKDNLVAAINEAAQGGGGGSSTLADLTDTNITNPEQGQTLRYEVVSGVGKWYNSASADMYKSDFAKYGLNGIVDNAMAIQLLYGDFDKLTRLSTDFIQLWDDTPTSYSFTFAGNSYAVGDNLVCFIDTVATMRNKIIFFDGYTCSYTDTNGGEVMSDRLTDTAIINETVPSDCDVTKPFSISVSIVGPVVGNACCYKGTDADTTSYPTSVSNTRFFKTTDGKLGFYNSVDGKFNLMGGGGTGDMLKSVYDTNDDGVVDKAEKVMFGSNAIEFGIDSQGRYGYKKVGADTVTPFRNPTGDATTDDVVYGKTFSNATGDGLTGTFMPMTVHAKSGDEEETIQTSSNAYIDMVIVDPMVKQSKTVSPSTSAQTVTPDSGYDGLSQVNVNAAPLQSKTVTPTSSSQNVTPDSGYYGLSKVTVNAASAPSGNISLGTYTSNGSKSANVSGYATCSFTVNVSSSATITWGKSTSGSPNTSVGTTGYTVNCGFYPIAVFISEGSTGSGYPYEGIIVRTSNTNGSTGTGLLYKTGSSNNCATMSTYQSYTKFYNDKVVIATSSSSRKLKSYTVYGISVS